MTRAERANAAAPSASGVGRDRGQRRVEHAREVEVVEADHRQLVRDRDADARAPPCTCRRRGCRRRRTPRCSRPPAARAAAAAAPSNANGALDARRRLEPAARSRASSRSARAAERRPPDGATPRWPMRRWPSSSRWATAASVPDSTSRRTTGSAPGADLDRHRVPGRARAARRRRRAARRRPGRRSSACERRDLPVAVARRVDQHDRVAGAAAPPAARRAARARRTGCVTSGTTSPTVRATPVRSARAATFGR